MLRIVVDSGSSIKQEEKEKYGVDIIPLVYSFNGVEYRDGLDLSDEEFYHKLIDEKLFPKTSLPSFTEIGKKIEEYTSAGDDVLIITISSKISGTYNALRLYFQDNKKVRVFDSLHAVGSVRLIVQEAIKYKDEPIDDIIERLNKLVPRVILLGVPDTLEYLHRGGRLARYEQIVANLLGIKVILTYINGEVKLHAKKIGKKKTMQYLAQKVKEDADLNYDIVGLYSYDKNNMDELVSYLDDNYKAKISLYDNIDHCIACHWGPNGYGFVYVKKES